MLTFALFKKFLKVIGIFLIFMWCWSCGRADLPELVTSPEKIQEIEEPIEVAKPTVEVVEIIEDTSATELENIIELNRGVSDQQVTIAIVKSGNVFTDVEIGVEALLERINEEGGIAERRIKVLEVFDDNGEEDLTLAAVQRIAQEDIFAVILASVSASSEVTDFLAQKQIPFFGWGFAEGFCEPNKWGFSFNGCMNFTLGQESSLTDESSLRLTSIFYGKRPELAIVTTNDSAGIAFAAQAQRVWGENLKKVVQLDFGNLTSENIIEEINDVDVDVLWLSIGLDRTIEVKRSLVNQFSGMVVDDVSYLPGILRSYDVAAELEGGYVFTQFPPQEEYRDATTQIMTDLKSIDGPLIYSQAISLGYWSADLLTSILNSVGEDLTLRNFFRVANVESTSYDSAVSGGPCSFQIALSHQDPAGGAALLHVRGGVFRPVVNFNCPLKD